MIMTDGALIGIILFLAANVSGFIWNYSKLTSITDNQQKEINQLRTMIEGMKAREDIMHKMHTKIDILIERNDNIREDVFELKARVNELER